jgi:hypothetical protein
VYTARQVAAQLLKIDPSHFGSRAPRAGVPELEALLQNPKKPGERYPILAPMLFPGNNGESLDVFEADVLVNVSLGFISLTVHGITNYFTSQFLKSVLHGKSSMDGDPIGKRPSKVALWGLTKTTPGMIALAATIVRFNINFLSSYRLSESDALLQMTFVCGPDQAFSEKAKGPSGVDWRARFSQYKCIVLRLPPAHRSRLLALYDERLFSRPPTSAIQTNSGAFESGVDEIDDLFQRLGDADVDSPFRSMSSASPPSFQYPSSSSFAPPSSPRPASLSFASTSSQRPASPPTEGDAVMSEPDVMPDVSSIGVVEDEMVESSKAKKKKATRAPRARRVRSVRKGPNAT